MTNEQCKKAVELQEEMQMVEHAIDFLGRRQPDQEIEKYCRSIWDTYILECKKALNAALKELEKQFAEL